MTLAVIIICIIGWEVPTLNGIAFSFIFHSVGKYEDSLKMPIKNKMEEQFQIWLKFSA